MEKTVNKTAEQIGNMWEKRENTWDTWWKYLVGQKWGENHGKTGEHLDNFLGKDTV